MRALDTNVVLRYLVTDDARQSRRAQELIAQPSLLSLTVLLETGWVLSSRYRFSRAQIAEILSGLIDLGPIHVEEPDGIRWAIGRYAAGADLADMIHLVAARSATAFATFDRSIAAAAGDAPPVPVETLEA